MSKNGSYSTRSFQWPSGRLSPVPVTLVTGWHGVGLCGFMARMARSLGSEKVGIVGTHCPGNAEAALVVPTEVETVEQVDGCGGCALRLDLIRVLRHIARCQGCPAHLLVEAGGWSDVVVATQTLLKDPEMRRWVRVAGVVALVHAPSMATRALSGQGPWPSTEMGEQVAMADDVVLTGTGDLTPEGNDAVRLVVGETNPFANIADDSSISFPALATRSRFDLVGAAAVELLTPASLAFDGVDTRVMLVEVHGDLDGQRVHNWVRALHHGTGARLLRIRGVIAVANEDDRLLCRGVGTFVEFDRGKPWASAVRTTKLLVAGTGLAANELAESLAACA